MDTGYQGDFIQRLSPTAQRLADKYNVLASLQVGLGAKESGWGGKSKKSRLVLEFNNLYGIKYASDIATKWVELGTFEWDAKEKKYKPAMAKWCVFNSWEESIEGFCRLITLRDRYKPVVASRCYQEAVYTVRTAGYSTSPTYIPTLRQLIKDYSLYELDLERPYKSLISPATPNFTWWESFSTWRVGNSQHQRAIEPPKMYWDNIARVAVEVQKLRNYYQKPIQVDSWYRTADFNAGLAGASKVSQHLTGRAIDLKPLFIIPIRDFYAKAREITNFKWFKMYSNFIHCDIREG